MVSLARPPSVRTAEVSCYTTRRRCAGIGEYPDAGQMIGNTRRTRQKEVENSGNTANRILLQSPSDLTATMDPSSATFWPRPPPRHDPPPRSSPGQPCPQTRNNPPRPHWRRHHRLGHLEKEQITHLLRTFIHCPHPKGVFLQQFGLHTTKALAVLLQNSFRNIVREDQADRRTADPPPPQADPRPQGVY